MLVGFFDSGSDLETAILEKDFLSGRFLDALTTIVMFEMREDMFNAFLLVFSLSLNASAAPSIVPSISCCGCHSQSFLGAGR